MKTKLLSILIIVVVAIYACKKEPYSSGAIVSQLHKMSPESNIEECVYNGKKVYTTQMNAVDAGATIYDENANVIGSCNYFANQVNAICTKLTGCEVVYRPENNLLGLPAIDKYGIDKK